ncbi:MAG: hypothetical protein ACI4MN_06075 [Candidatus Coproplasma sp.]
MHNLNNSTQLQLPPKVVKNRPNKAFASFVDAITLTVVGILVVVIILLYLTEISFNTGVNLLEFGFQSLVLYLASISIYFLLRSFARRKGRLTDGWQKAFKRIESLNDAIVESGAAGRIPEYCRIWEDEELDGSRERILADAGISLDDFKNKYLKYSKRELKKAYSGLTKFELRIILKAKRLKRLKYSTSYLSVNNSYGSRKAPNQYISTRTLEIFNGIQKAVTMLFTAIFGVTLCVNLVSEPTLATVVMCLVKVIIVLFSGAVGMAGGYNVSSVKAVEEMGNKIDEQRRFLKWCGVDIPEVDIPEN